jgi:hypothetical protein
MSEKLFYKKKRGCPFETVSSVPPSEPNVNQILEDTRALAQIWDLYGHLLSEDQISNSEQKESISECRLTAHKLQNNALII